MADAVEWEKSALAKRPWRTEFFARLAAEIAGFPKKIHRVLEIGSGPGFLARQLLESLNDISCVLLDFSPAMHQLARDRLTGFEERVQFVERDFKQDNWIDSLGRFDCVLTNQAVHELRHKSRAVKLHTQVREILESGGLYLVCDHFIDPDGMKKEELYMSADEQRLALLAAGFVQVDRIMVKGTMVLHRAR